MTISTILRAIEEGYHLGDRVFLTVLETKVIKPQEKIIFLLSGYSQKRSLFRVVRYPQEAGIILYGLMHRKRHRFLIGLFRYYDKLVHKPTVTHNY